MVVMLDIQETVLFTVFVKKLKPGNQFLQIALVILSLFVLTIKYYALVQINCKVLDNNVTDLHQKIKKKF